MVTRKWKSLIPNISLIFFLLLGMQDSFGRASKRVEVDPIPTPSVEPIPMPTPDSSGVNISFICANCGAEEKLMVPKMQILLNALVKDPCFGDHFINPKFRSQLVQTNGLTRTQVVEKIKNSVIKDIPLFFYYPTWKQSRNVIGYTYPDQPEIYLNRLFRQDTSWGLCDEVSNEIHESTHKIGFDHDYKATPQRPYSVPYTANYASDSCCPALLKAMK